MFWDDGQHAKVKRVQLTFDDVIKSIQVEYEGTTLQSQPRGSVGSKSDGFTLAPDEYITELSGYYKTTFTGDVITALTFKTNKNTYGPYGNKTRNNFTATAPKDKQIAGFLGTCGDALSSIDVHFAPIPPLGSTGGTTNGTGGTTGGISSGGTSGTETNTGNGSNTDSSTQKVEAQGGKGHNIWDDGGNHDGITKIHIGPGGLGIENIKFEYVKNGQPKEGPLHGMKGRGGFSSFVINHPTEYLISVKGWYDSTNIIQGIEFKTNTKTSDIFGYEFAGDGTEFSLKVKDKKIVGFHGTSSSHLNSLGAYFVPINSTPLTKAKKLQAKGGNGEASWDDGVFDSVTKVFVGQGNNCVAFVMFEYKKGSQVILGEGRGKKTHLGTETFVVDPDDYITSVKVHYNKIIGYETEVITALTFKTSKGITSKQFGKTSYDMFLLDGGKIKGFHGSSSDVLHSLGAYMSLSSTPMLDGKWIHVEQKSDGSRCSHTIAMVGDKMYSFGGELRPNFPIDRHLYIFDFKTHTWSLAPPNGEVPKLSCLGVTMVAIGTTLYIFGGRDGQRKYNGFYSYDTVKSEWKLLTHVDKGPTPRSFHAMAADDKNVYVFGGVSATERLNTLHGYNIYDHKWTELPNPGETCKPRGGAGLGVVKGKIWVVYGFTGDSMDDVHCFDLVTNKWTKVETKGEKPFPRSVFAMAVLGKYIVISCGEIQMDPKAHLGPGKLTDGTFVLDTESLMWEKLEDGPSPRGWCASTTGTIDGKKGLLMYGGKAPTNDRYSDIFFYGVDNA